MPQDEEKSYCKPKDGKDQTNGKSEAKRNGTRKKVVKISKKVTKIMCW